MIKILIKEGRTVPVHPELLRGTIELYRSAYWTMVYILSSKDPKKKSLLKMLEKKANKSFYDFFTSKGLDVGANLVRMRDEGELLPLKKTDLSLFAKDEEDPITSRKDKDQIEKTVSKLSDKYKVLFFNISFKKRGPPDEEYEKGSFTPKKKTLDIVFNLEEMMKLPSKNDEQNMDYLENLFSTLVPTIKHELQHAVQLMYPRFMGLTHPIGVASKSSLNKDYDYAGRKKGSPRTKKKPFKYDIPLEITTYLQQEIDEITNTIKKYSKNKVLVGDIIRNYVGIPTLKYKATELPLQAVESDLFKHLKDNNPEAWKWAVGKLMSAIE